MFLARVIGQVVATKKEPEMHGRRLLLLRPMLADEKATGTLRPGSNTVVAVDGLGAGQGEMVLFVQGSSARKCSGFSALPIDAAVVGIVDSVSVEGQSAYDARTAASGD